MIRGATMEGREDEARQRDDGDHYARSRLGRLSKQQRRAVRGGTERLAKHGRAGATAQELGGGNEREGLRMGVWLVQLGLAVVTRTNRFVLMNYAGKRVPNIIEWDG